MVDHGSVDESRIDCPNCGQEIDVNDILTHQVEDRIKKSYGEQQARDKKQLQAQMDALQQQRLTLEQEKQAQQAATDQAISDGIKQREKLLQQQLKKKLEEEQSERFAAMTKELEEKSEQVKSFNKAKSDIERLKREKDELRDVIQAESEQKLNQRLAEESEKLYKSVEQKNQMVVAERDKVISDLNNQLKDAQRKAEQGSMQLQGEVQELAIEQWLQEQFPLDTIDEVKKGAFGADCLQIVHTRSRQNCGTIYYESKRTKAFSASWMDKFKQDIRDRGADVGVLVTEAMPSDMERVGLRDGIWICTFDEFRGLSTVLRDAAIRMSNAIATQENKGDKMGMLYDFLTGSEFRSHVEAIVEGFTQMRSDLEAEKRSMQSHWKKREKQLEKVLLNTNYMYGSIKGIAGTALQSVALLELDDSEDE